MYVSSTCRPYPRYSLSVLLERAALGWGTHDVENDGDEREDEDEDGKRPAPPERVHSQVCYRCSTR